MALQSYRDLEVWQKGMDLTVECYATTRAFPKEEMFGLTSQIRKASSSNSANLAEGHGRPTTKDFLRFIGIARGSLNELEMHLILSQRLGYIHETRLDALLSHNDTISRMLAGLTRSIERRSS